MEERWPIWLGWLVKRVSVDRFVFSLSYSKAKDVELIPATTEHHEILAEFNEKMIKASGHNNELDRRSLTFRMKEWIESGEYAGILLRLNKQLIGYALFKQEQKLIFLRQFFIDDSFRRKGLGTSAILQLLENYWKDSDLVYLNVHSENSRAINFWRSIGFVGPPAKMTYHLAVKANLPFDLDEKLRRST